MLCKIFKAVIVTPVVDWYADLNSRPLLKRAIEYANCASQASGTSWINKPVYIVAFRTSSASRCTPS